MSLERFSYSKSSIGQDRGGLRGVPQYQRGKSTDREKRDTDMR